ncbi:MAG: hypothetical protein C0392_05865 [Syntrophus sp. (in: bacteria)]|nr:hypothetical protein [Syntrophus sp. (in: bacteria)]
MKKAMVKKVLVLAALVMFVCVGSTSYAADTKAAPKKEKGVALQQLEGAAGKKIEDVKVPEVPKPTQVNKK